MQLCKSGHYYDADKNIECPYCSNHQMGRTRPLTSQEQTELNKSESNEAIDESIGYPKTSMGIETDFPKTMPIKEITFPKTMPIEQVDFPKTEPIRQSTDIMATAPMIGGFEGRSPVLGWLVCTEGIKRGKDYRICTEKAYIGRAQSNDIALDFDNTISRDTTVIIAFHRQKREFWLDASQSRNNIYVNNELVMSPVCLKNTDNILIGNTVLKLICLCGNEFMWE
jgi:hypothetical protein